jgi:vacuolar-type H+-ATPase subunit C/Vma6
MGATGKQKVCLQTELRMSDYADLKSKTSVYDIVSFLKNHPGYEKLLSNVSERTIDRISLESILRKKVQTDFIKLLKFTNEDDRKFLKYYVYQNVVDQILKI